MVRYLSLLFATQSRHGKVHQSSLVLVFEFVDNIVVVLTYISHMLKLFDMFSIFEFFLFSE